MHLLPEEEAVLDRVQGLQAQAAEKVQKLSAAIKHHEATQGESCRPSVEIEELRAELHALQESSFEALRELQQIHGIPEELLVAIERSRLPPQDDRLWRKQVETVEPSEDLDELSRSGYARLLEKLGDTWLEESRRECHWRLDEEYLHSPLSLVGGMRLASRGSQPRRFAQMILVCGDHIARRNDLDFFSASMVKWTPFSGPGV